MGRAAIVCEPASSTPLSHREIIALHGVATAHFTISFEGNHMELSDRIFTVNRDWDPSYLRYIISQDFYDFCDLWANALPNEELLRATESSPGRYCPVVEDLSVDNDTLYEAVAKIEEE